MNSRMFKLLRHEIPWVGDFLAMLPPTTPSIDNLKQRLDKAYSDTQQPVVQLTDDDVRLCVDGYEQQASTKWVKGKPLGKKPVEDTTPRFSAEQTELYQRLKRFLQGESEEWG